jgi:isopenicillin-N epimerase
MLPLDIPSLGCDFYTGNLHKWAMSPRSCAILWAAPERQAALHPTVISWGYGLGMSAEFDLVGTRDPSPFLGAPEGIAFLRELGLDEVRAYNHALAWETAKRFTERWGTEIPGPESMYGSMVTVLLPERVEAQPAAVQRLKDALLFEDGIETQIHVFRGRVCLRIAAQIYNEAEEYERLWAGIARRIGE